MNTLRLKIEFFFILLLLCSLGVVAQQSRFIYIQTENKQPFYVKMDKRIFSSSVSGYMIIPRLMDKAYELVIGFPQNEWTELNVTVNIKDTNAGFLLKNYGDKGWGMTNLQTMQLLVMQKSQYPNNESEVNQSENEFARILAAVVNDPSIARVKGVKKTAEVSVDTLYKKSVVKEMIDPASTDLNKGDALIAKTEILKLSQDSSADGILVTYLDKEDIGRDTVKIFIPVSKKPVVTGEEKKPEVLNTVAKNKNTDKKDSRFLDMELQNPNVKSDSGAVTKDDFVITEKKTVESNTGKEINKAGCKTTATQHDFLELRKQMAAEASEKSMNKIATKQFIKTCFTTEQIKSLGILFITEDERYKFYVTAFPFISDTDKFATLEDQLTDNYYKTRFKAMFSH